MNAAEARRAVLIERRAARILQNAKDDPKTSIVGLRWINLAIDRFARPLSEDCDRVLSESLFRMRAAIYPIAVKAFEEGR